MTATARADSDAGEPGWSFCITSNGLRPGHLRREIESIRRLEIPRFEIVVAGLPPADLAGVRVIPMREAALTGRLGRMRNRLVEAARFDRLVLCDDDLVFRRDFQRGIEARGLDFDALGVRVLNPDGTRYWDWATIDGPRGHRLLDYDEEDRFAYLSGCVMVLRTEVARAVGWDDGLGYYESEDVDFSRRLAAAGYRIGFCRDASVLHDDPRYRQYDMRVRRLEGLAHWPHRVRARLRRSNTIRSQSPEGRWRRARLPVRDAAPRLLVVGLPRAGSAWVARCLAALSALPFAPDPYPQRGSQGSLRLPDYQPAGAEGAAALAASLSDCVGRAAYVHPPRRWDRLGLRIGTRGGAVFRDVAAPLAAEAAWGEGGLQVVVLLRHPCAMLASWHRQGWALPPELPEAFLGQPALVEAHLGPARAARLRQLDGPAARFGAVWSVVYGVLLRQAACRGWSVLRYEDLAPHPGSALRAVLRSHGIRPRRHALHGIEVAPDFRTDAVGPRDLLSASDTRECLEGASLFASLDAWYPAPRDGITPRRSGARPAAVPVRDAPGSGRR